jgi:FkbM family methyltransferase
MDFFRVIDVELGKMLNIFSVNKTVKKVALSAGLYRPGTFRRWFNRDYLNKFNQDISFFSKLLEPNPLCFDIGANIGEKSEILLSIGANVVAFEPQLQCVEQLKARCRPYRKQLQIRQTALGSEMGEAEFYASETSALSSFFQDWSDSTTKLRVSVTTLDRAIAEFGKPNYCKIDVEGWELEVLKGLTQPIPLISIEYHLGEREVNIVRDCLAYLSQFGELQINITTAETLVFSLQEWVSLEKFLELFPDTFRDRYEYRYGDIFICTNS